MPTVNLTLNQPINSSSPSVTVITNVPAGRYLIQLVVIDDSGLESAPVETTITIQGVIGTTGLGQNSVSGSEP